MTHTNDCFNDDARQILDELAVTDSSVTVENIRKVIREDYGSYPSRSELTGIIATALMLAKQTSSEQRE